MIAINLLPHHLRPIKRSPLPYLVSGASLVVFVVFLLLDFSAVSVRVARAKETMEANVGQFETMRPTVEESNALEAEKIGLQNRVDTIEEIVSSRIIWSQQLWELGDLKPNNIWYSGVEVTKKDFLVQETRLDPESGAEIVEDKRITRPVLELSGYATEDERGNRDVNPLIDNLTQDPEFSSMFIFDRQVFQPDEFEGFTVREFTLDFVISSAAREGQ